MAQNQDHQFTARWEPLFQKDDFFRLRKLSDLMPYPVRALVTTEADLDAPPAVPPFDLTQRLLAHLVDDTVRSAQPQVKTNKNKPVASMHDCWLSALSQPDGLMCFDDRNLASLAQEIEEWKRPLVYLEQAPFKLCFRLDEPSNLEVMAETELAASIKALKLDDWRITYMLQHRHDQSLLIPARDAWQRNSEAEQALSGAGFKPREYLLLSLSRASRLFPEITSSLEESRPNGFALDSNSAFQFLNQTAPSLEQAGFGVILPGWWTNPEKKRIRAQAHVTGQTMRADAGLNLEALLDFKWQISLGTETLTLSELKRLADLKAPLIYFRGEWIHVSQEEIRSAIEFLEKKANETGTARDAIRMAIGAGNLGSNLDISVESDGWIADLVDQFINPAKVEELEAPPGFVGQLRPYQKRGYAWLSFLERCGFGSCLADDMGLGKT
ncbi:MAG: SNF2 helicase-associated domain-containing protein, partial [Terriglobales bacterium]